MLLLQVVASMGWNLRSFDIKAAFLQGKNQKDRVLAIEPVAEIINMMNLKPQEICNWKRAHMAWLMHHTCGSKPSLRSCSALDSNNHRSTRACCSQESRNLVA